VRAKIGDGGTGYLLDPSCTGLIRGKRETYQFRKMQGTNDISSVKPTFDTHVADAEQYMAMECGTEAARRRRGEIRAAAPSAARKAAAAGRYNPMKRANGPERNRLTAASAVTGSRPVGSATFNAEGGAIAPWLVRTFSDRHLGGTNGGVGQHWPERAAAAACWISGSDPFTAADAALKAQQDANALAPRPRCRRSTARARARRRRSQRAS
jgi:hypothetical protein